ncbi:MAG: hypothetical protein C0417_08050 [Chlorobiaceae bacterium]|nr:hypothetical protein [Chlorobiaceae bacterium]
MSIMLDIFGSLLIAGIMFLTIFSLMGNMNQANIEKTLNVNVQGDIITLAQILESDLLKIGYHTKNDAIQYADSSGIRFKSDLVNDSTIVTVQYTLGGNVTTTKNPKDKFIIRSVDGQTTINASVGLTYIHYSYFDSLGRELTSPLTTTNRLDSIKAIRVKIRLESAEPVASPYSITPTYQSVFWEKTIYPRNL